MAAWHFGRTRYVPRALRERMRRDCSALVLSNVQPQVVVPFLVSARRLGIPIVAHIASWDHTVGKGVIAPFCDVYIVQNATMRDDLTRYHEIEPGRIVVTGWPQTDVYARQRPREDFDAVVRSFDLDPALPLVAVMGNTPTNAPFEDRFVERVVRWWEAEGRGRMTLLFRPHPRDRAWRERYAAALSTPGVHVQEASFTDLDVLATILQHASCVVANAGTILLEALVNDRPAVCVLYDEGAPPGESWAMKNVIGEHYRELADLGRLLSARSGSRTWSAGIERSLADPAELPPNARRVVSEIVGDVDGRAAERVVDAIARTVVPLDEARHDAPGAKRGGHRRRAARVPPERRRRLRASRPTTVRRRDDGDPRAVRARRSPPSHPEKPATTCARGSGSRAWRASPRPSSAPTG